MKTTKFQKAIDIVQKVGAKQCIGVLMNDLGVKKGNAYVYRSKVLKVLNSNTTSSPSRTATTISVQGPVDLKYSSLEQ